MKDEFKGEFEAPDKKRRENYREPTKKESRGCLTCGNKSCKMEMPLIPLEIFDCPRWEDCDD